MLKVSQLARRIKLINISDIYRSTQRPFSDSQDQETTPLAPKEMAQRIQHIIEGGEEASEWIKNHTFSNYKDKWYKLHYNHQVYNLQNAVDFFERTDKFEIDRGKLFNDPTTKIEYIDSDNYYIERLNDDELLHELGDNLYYGPNEGIRNKVLVSEFHQLYGVTDRFYIPVDISHLFEGDVPCLLHLLFTPEDTFVDRWKHVRLMKENKDNYLFEDDKWMQYLATVPGWITGGTFRDSDSDDTIFVERPYKEPIAGKKVQGLTIMMSPTIAYWSFSFHDKPECMEYFIEKYKLKKLNIKKPIHEFQ